MTHTSHTRDQENACCIHRHTQTDKEGGKRAKQSKRVDRTQLSSSSSKERQGSDVCVRYGAGNEGAVYAVYDRMRSHDEQQEMR